MNPLATAGAFRVRVGRVDDIPLMEGRSTVVAGRRIAVFNLPEGFVAIDGACPHAGGPLADGIVADRCVTCPLHGRRIDLHTGEVTGGPERGVRTYHVVVEGEELFIEVPTQATRADDESGGLPKKPSPQDSLSGRGA